MNKNLYSNFHPAVQLIFMLLITIVSFFFVMIAALIIGVMVYRVPVNEWMGLLDMNNPANLGVLKFIQITQALALFVIPPIIVGLLAIGKPFKYLGLRTNTAGSDLLLVMLILLVSLPVFNLLAIWNEGLQLPSFMSGIEHWMKATEEQAGQLTEKFLAAGSFGTYLINVIMIALIPAFGEEFMFRGVIQRQLGQWFKNPHWAIVITAILFSALHLQFYGFLPRFGLGLLFGYLFYWSGNLWFPVAAHFLNNFIPVSLVYFMKDRFSPADIEHLGNETNAWIWALPALLLTIAMLLVFYRRQKQPVN